MGEDSKRMKTYTRYYIQENNNGVRNIIDIHDNPSKRGTTRYFYTREDAQRWIDTHSYAGMVHRYEIVVDHYI